MFAAVCIIACYTAFIHYMLSGDFLPIGLQYKTNDTAKTQEYQEKYSEIISLHGHSPFFFLKNPNTAFSAAFAMTSLYTTAEIITAAA